MTASACRPRRWSSGSGKCKGATGQRQRAAARTADRDGLGAGRRQGQHPSPDLISVDAPIVAVRPFRDTPARAGYARQHTGRSRDLTMPVERLDSACSFVSVPFAVWVI